MLECSSRFAPHRAHPAESLAPVTFRGFGTFDPGKLAARAARSTSCLEIGVKVAGARLLMLSFNLFISSTIDVSERGCFLMVVARWAS